jgi:hypothetical protein
MKAEILNIEVEVTITWKCPVCNATNYFITFPSSRRIPADEIPEDVQCINCKGFFDPK